MKILFAASKEMNLDKMIKHRNTIHFKESHLIIDFIKSISEQDSYHVFKTKENIHSKHQLLNVKSKYAIDLFTGISFRQITNKNNPSLSNLCILNSVYGLSYAFDYISYFRYDYTMKQANVNRKSIYKKINQKLKHEDIIYNLASKEFSKGIDHHNMIDFSFYQRQDDVLKQHSVASKILRGQMVNYIIDNEKPDLTLFSYNDYKYSHTLSSTKHIVYIKDILTP